MIKGYKGDAKDVIVPSSIEDFPVVSCDLSKNETIVSVVIPDSCLSLNFDHCTSLEKVTLPKDLKVLPNGYVDDFVAKGVFYSCTALKAITLPEGLEKIGSYAFCYSGLESIVIPDSVQSIGHNAFSNCKALTTVSIGNGVQSIGGSAFYYCEALASVTIGNGVQSIENYAFEGCTALTTVTIGNGIQSIGRHAFYGCSSLTTVNVEAENIQYGYSDAFSGCSSLPLKEKLKIKKTGYTGSF